MADINILNTGSAEVDPRKLTLHEMNPRQGDVGAITESFRINGFWGRVVVDKRTGKVLAGNHRVLAARALDMPVIPVEYVETETDEQAARILLADNRHSDIASYDEHTLAELLENLAQSPAGLDGTGYDGDDLDDLLGAMADPDWSEGNTERLENQRNSAFVRPVIAIEDVRTLEDALSKTGKVNRAEALVEICKHYLNEEG